MSDIQRIDFQQQEILSWRDKDSGTIVASLKAMCEPLGLDLTTQLKRIRGNPLFAGGLRRGRQIPTPGGKQEVYGLDLDLVQLWLASINSSRINEEKRATLLVYQRECAQVLRDYWTQGTARTPQREVPHLPTPKDTLDTLYACRTALQELGCFDDRDTITFAAYVRRIAATAMQPLLPAGSPDPTAPDVTQPVLWTLSMRLQYLKHPPLTGVGGDGQHIRMGSMAKKAYQLEYGEAPKKLWDFVRGQQRPVNAYPPDRVHILDEAITAVLGPPRLQLITT